MASRAATTMRSRVGIVWFKFGDLRVRDNHALVHAHTHCDAVLHLFVFDPHWFGRTASGLPRMAYHRARFLLESVADLRKSLRDRGSTLFLRVGDSADVLAHMARATGADVVYTHTEVATEEKTVETRVRKALSALPKRAELRCVWGNTLYDVADLPFRVTDDMPQVFSQFRRQVEGASRIPAPLDAPRKAGSSETAPRAGAHTHTHTHAPACVMAPTPALAEAAPLPPLRFPCAEPGDRGMLPPEVNVGEGALPSLTAVGAHTLLPALDALMGLAHARTAEGEGDVKVAAADALKFMSTAPQQLRDATASPMILTDAEVDTLPHLADERGVLRFKGGETAALARMQSWIWDGDHLKSYKLTRNGLLGGDYSSKFSPWLAAGCISPRTISASVREYESRLCANDSTYWLLFELIWRDFFKFAAVGWGSSMFKLLGPRGDAAGSARAWRRDARSLVQWCSGRTGYPFVDANMRELLATGFMSNRGRQNVASFFVKDLDMDWRLGAEWFESLLLDHDPASNYGNWTYVAGVGSDPREDRYFLIPKQSRDYDRNGDYMRAWLPELADVPTEALHDPHRHVPALRSRTYPPVCVTLMAHRDGRGGRPDVGHSSHSSGGKAREARDGRGNGKGFRPPKRSVHTHTHSHTDEYAAAFPDTIYEAPAAAPPARSGGRASGPPPRRPGTSTRVQHL